MSLMFKKIEIWILYLTVLLCFAGAVFFGWLIKQELLTEEPRFPTFSKAAGFLVDIPAKIKILLRNPTQDRIIEVDRFTGKTGFIGEGLKDEVYLLLSRYDGDLESSIIELVDLGTFKTLHSWKPDIEKINALVDFRNPKFQNIRHKITPKLYRCLHPLLNSDGSIVFHNWSPLVKIDFSSHLVWQNQDNRFHHATELDAEGNYWIPTRMYPFSINPDYVGEEDLNDHMWDEGITQVSQDGKILFQKSLSELFMENDMKYLLFSVGDMRFTRDPIHLNDIQPALEDSKFWKKGDVFLSLRHQSMVILYRPKTNKIIWKGVGHTYHQHDIDIINDHQISIFNNNSIDTIRGDVVDGCNEVVIYDFETDKYSYYLSSALVDNDVRTVTEGLAEILPNGDLFIEETDYGRALYFNNDGTLRWEHVNRAKNGKLYGQHWSRILYKKEDKEMVRNMLKVK